MYANQHAGCLYCDEIFRKLVTLPPKKEVQAETVETEAHSNIGIDGEELPIKKEESSAGIISKKKKKRR